MALRKNQVLIRLKPRKIVSNASYKKQFWNLNTFNIQILNFKNIFFCGINSTVFTSLTTIQWLKIFYDIDKWINKNTISMSEFNLIAFWMRVWFCMQSKLIVSGGVLMKIFQIPDCWVLERHFLYLSSINSQAEGWLLKTKSRQNLLIIGF